MWANGIEGAYESLGLPGTELPINERKPGDVNKQDFMLLLMAQLKNQDPSEPVSNSEFLAQLAQFNQMESMLDMSNNIDALVRSNNLSRGGSLIGRVVSGLDMNTGDPVKGFVSKVSIIGDDVTLHVEEYDEGGTYLGTHSVSMDSITEIEF